MARLSRRRLAKSRTRGAATKAIIASKAPKSQSPTPDLAEAVAAKPLPSTRRFRRGGMANILVMTVAAGIVGTLAIPAYAIAPGSIGPQFGETDATKLSKAQAQTVETTGDVIAAPVTEDGYKTVTGESIRAAERAAAEAEAARIAAENAMASYAASYDGPSASELLANPPYPNFDLASVYSVAESYTGVPYVYGGATPAGFDCSGFVMYVYAQFGVSMPHSSSGQGAMGTVISEADAQPGDLVIMDGHDGFYAGNGMILHAPYEGASVRVQPIWTSDYYIVRIGI